MPYIEQDTRDNLDPIINMFLPQFEGLENDDLCSVVSYIISKMTWELCGHNDTGHRTYARMNAIMGVLKGAPDEFYRRIVVPYEDKKIK